jgi:hypothetical protein
MTAHDVARQKPRETILRIVRELLLTTAKPKLSASDDQPVP